MKFILTGTGTSQGVPVIGCACPACISDDERDHRLRTAAYVKHQGTGVVIDVGPDFRQQMLRIGAERLDAILLTHEHNDHVAGLDDIRPFNFLQRQPLDLYALPRVIKDVRQRFSYIFATEAYPGAPRVHLHELDAYQALTIGDLTVQTFPVRHGQIEVVGFRIGDISYVTDANMIPRKSMDIIDGSSTLVLNALHHRRHHSHFNLEQAIKLSDTLDVDTVYFTHISHHMGCHATVQAELPPGRFLAYDGLEVPCLGH